MRLCARRRAIWSARRSGGCCGRRGKGCWDDRSDLVAVLIEGDLDELAAGTDSELVEQAAEEGFDGAFGDVEADSDLLVGITFEEAAEGDALAVGEVGAFVDGVGVDGSEEAAEVAGFEVDFAGGDFAGGIAEQVGRVVFVEDAGDTGLNQLHGFEVGDSGGDDEDFAGVALGAGLADEVEGSLIAEVDIEEDQLGVLFGDALETSGDVVGFADDFEIGLGLEETGEAFAEEGVVIDEVEGDFGGLCTHGLPLGNAEFGDETAATGDGLKAEIAAVAAEDGAGDVEAESALFGACAEGLEQVFGVGDAGAGVGDGDADVFGVSGEGDGEGTFLRGGDGTETVLMEIEECLKDTEGFTEDAGEVVGNVPDEIAADFVPGGGDHDAEVAEDFGEVGLDFAVGGFGGEFGGGDLGEGGDKVAEGVEILAVFPVGRGAQLGVDHADGSADVADFVGDGAGDDAVVFEQLAEVLLFAFADFLGDIDGDGGEAAAEGGLVGGEPDLRDEEFAACLAALALGGGAEGG